MDKLTPKVGLPEKPYRVRPTRMIGVRECNGWQFKLYEITAEGEAIPTAIMDAALAFIEENVVWPYEVADRFGFAIVHIGDEGVWALAHVWTNDILRQFVFRAPVDQPEHFSASPLPGFNACVWELEVTKHERDAWVRHVMSTPQQPDFDAYLRDGLTIA